MRSCRVIEDWTASYDDPITLDRGESFALSGKTDRWDGHLWLWARSGAGREGWVPDTLADTVEGRTVARYAYSAQELTCRKGELLEVIDRTHGWCLCRRDGGATGWVPEQHLARS